MKKVVRLTESELKGLITKAINNINENYAPQENEQENEMELKKKLRAFIPQLDDLLNKLYTLPGEDANTVATTLDEFLELADDWCCDAGEVDAPEEFFQY